MLYHFEGKYITVLTFNNMRNFPLGNAARCWYDERIGFYMARLIWAWRYQNFLELYRSELPTVRHYPPLRFLVLDPEITDLKPSLGKQNYFPILIEKIMYNVPPISYWHWKWILNSAKLITRWIIFTTKYLPSYFTSSANICLTTFYLFLHLKHSLCKTSKLFQKFKLIYLLIIS